MSKKESLTEKLEPMEHSVLINFIALGKPLTFKISSNSALDSLLAEFALLFSKTIDYENRKVTVNPLQTVTPELRNNFKQFVDLFKDKEPRVNQLNEYLKGLNDGYNFYLIVNHEVTTDDMLNLSNHLVAIKEGESYEAVKGRMDDVFKALFAIYDIRGYDKNTKSSIGEKDKSKRICRFCGLGSPSVTFKSVAHAISEALGNKEIILNEECDICNNKYSKIEMDLISYLKFYNIFYGIKGKEKIPSLPQDGKRNFDAVYEEGKGMVLKYFPNDVDEKEKEEFPLNLKLNTNEFITDQNIYKTLVKYALSVIDSKNIKHFKKTIDWIDGKVESSNLPRIGMLVTNEFFDKHPRLMVYTRRIDDKKLPHLVGELSFTALTFMFIVPFSDQDETEFITKPSFDHFWDTFRHYNRSSGWGFLNFSNNTRHELKINLTFDIKEKTR